MTEQTQHRLFDEVPPTVRQIVDQYVPAIVEGDEREALIAALIAREDAIADMLRIAGANLGASTPLVAFALAETTLGTPVDDETRSLLHVQFHEEVERIQEMMRRMQGGEQ